MIISEFYICEAAYVTELNVSKLISIDQLTIMPSVTQASALY